MPRFYRDYVKVMWGLGRDYAGIMPGLIIYVRDFAKIGSRSCPLTLSSSNLFRILSAALSSYQIPETSKNLAPTHANRRRRPNLAETCLKAADSPEPSTNITKTYDKQVFGKQTSSLRKCWKSIRNTKTSNKTITNTQEHSKGIQEKFGSHLQASILHNNGKKTSAKSARSYRKPETLTELLRKYTETSQKDGKCLRKYLTKSRIP